MSYRRRLGFKFTAGLMMMLPLVACQAQAGPAAASAASIGLRPSDLPKALARCTASGDLGRYLAQHPRGASSTALSKQWDEARAAGADQGQIELYSSDSAACDLDPLAAQSEPTAASLVVRYPTPAAARQVWGGGFLGIRPLNAAEHASWLTQGYGTGLGVNSWTYDSPESLPGVHISYWQSDRFTLLLLTTHLPSEAARPIAERMNGRVR